MNTPWGKSDSKITLARGVSLVGTPGHGGFAITPSAALKYLSTAAVARATKYGGYYFFEEDCDAFIVLLELPVSLLEVLGGVIQTEESLVKSLSYWHLDYLQERGITPNAEGAKFFQENRLADTMRRDKSPNLIVSASGDWADWVPAGKVGVITADNRRYLVPEAQYDNRVNLNLLSNYHGVQAVA